MAEWRTIVAGTTLVGAAVFGAVGLVLGTVSAMFYAPSDAWISGLILAAGAGFVGSAVGTVAGFLYTGLRAMCCRREVRA